MFRFSFVGVILTLIVYPCAIVVNSVISAILIISFWAWVPLIMCATYLFNILIFQFESSHIPYGIIIRSIPLLSLALDIVRSFLKVVFLILLVLLFAPFCALCVLLFSIIQRIFRRVTDFMMLFLIRKLGRTPSKNSAVAKKISGPGMSREYYMSITEEDVYILTQAELEKLYMREFQRLVTTKISSVSTIFLTVMNIFLRPYQLQYNKTLNKKQNIIF
eukprot:GHVR01051117.1.p1 GENE.GHVR01051117.1~~GHVR01051117.1.p1  ORF type:complete len:219 (+),score=-9.19 GHVR01051117.1:5790-6446(+)